MHLIEHMWIIALPANAIELREEVLHKFHASAIGGYLSYRKLGALFKH